jgi:thermitase
MNANHVNKNTAFLKAGLLILTSVMQVVFAGTLSAKQPLRQKTAALTDPNTTQPFNAEPSYVPGEVIIKLRDGQAGGAVLSTVPYATTVTRQKAALLRLQTKYAMQEADPVFKGVHQRLEQRGTTRNASAAGAAAYAQQVKEVELSQFYLLKTQQDVPSLCSQLKNDPDVEYAQPNYIYKRCAEPNDPEFPDQYAHQLIQMTDAWDISTGSHDVVVAVLGTGVDVSHPDLKDNIWINENEIPDNGEDDDQNGYIDDIYGWNFESNNNQVTPSFAIYGIEGHETMVAGVIAATGNNGIGVTGVNWQCSIMALRLSVFMTSAQVAEGLDYAAANGADILNMSFSSDDFGPEGDPIVNEAIDNAFEHGILLTGSAGNDDMAKANYPAAYYNVMAVASTDGEDIKTGHSNYGPWIDISAPGTDIVTTDLDGEYISTAGTSFSAPYVAAVGALVLSYRPQLTNIELRAILENTTDPVYYGMVNPDECYIGTGRVNAYQALLGADTKYPLGEIVKPKQAQTFAQDVNIVPIVLFVHGDTYRLEYTQYGKDDWILIGEGNVPADPNGFVKLSLTNPGIGTFELKLSVTSEGYTHTDRKVFGFGMGAEQASWPKPEEVDPYLFPFSAYFGSSICMDIDGDNRNEIIQPQLTYTSLYWYLGEIAIWDEDGTPLPGWPQGYYDSYDVPQCTVGDIDGDGDYEVVGTYGLDGIVFAWHVETGELLDGDWPLDIGQWYGWIIANPVLADLDGDGDNEIIAALDLDASDIDGLYAIQGDGSFLWQRRYTTEGPMSVADINGDGHIEIALSGYGPGVSSMYTYILSNTGQQIKRWRGGSNKGTVISDIDGDGQFELIFCTEDSVQAVHIDGSTLWSTNIDDPFSAEGALSVGDIDDDGYGEVYITSNVESDGYSFTIVHAFDHQGRLLTDKGFPKTIMGSTYFNPLLIGDIDGDGQKELVAGMSAAPVIAWEADGSTTPGFPILDLWTELNAVPSLGDLDQDGDIELMVGGYDYRFHVIDLPGQYDPNTIDWGMSRHDPQCSGWTTKGPELILSKAPDRIRPGERLELTLTATNPSNGPLHFFVGNLPEGAYYDPNTLTLFWKPTADQVFHTYHFSFMVTDGIHQSSQSALIRVVPRAIYYTDMETNPNWQLDEGWAWGTPTGQGSWNGDPQSGYTGENVIGFNLDGDYSNSIQTTRYATVGPVNCQQYTNIRLSFCRWLGLEAPYDQANVQVSNDGTNWTDIWTSGYSHISDSSWQLAEYALPSAVADQQSMVYIRWGIGPTDESVTYPGWNIDDVQLTGDRIE